MLGVQYSFYKMDVTFTLCQGLYIALKSVNVTHIRCVTFQRTCSNKQVRYGIIPFVSAIFSTLYISLIDLTNALQLFNYKYIIMFLMTNMLIIIIGLLMYKYYYFLLYTRFHSSPVEHENLRAKFVLMDNSTNFF